MKFAVACLIGAASAGSIQLPHISWDEKAMQAGVNTAAEYGVQADNLDQRHKLAEAKDLAQAFATFQTQVAVNYAKTVKPYEQAKVAYLDAITVDGNCNQAAASQCVYLEYGLEPKKQSFQQCLAAAKCQTNWDKLTPA